MSDNAEEQVSINQPGPDELEPVGNGESPTIKDHTPDLSTRVKDGASKAEVLDAILSTSRDEMLPWEELKLPSLGYYYNGKIPDGVIKVRPMGIFADKILATARLAQTGMALDHIYKHCVQLPNGFSALDLLSNDRIYILYYLRGITHGEKYEFVYQCPNTDCSHRRNTHMYDLNDLYKTIKFPRSDAPEPFKVRLPYLSGVFKRDVYVGLKFMRGREEQAMFRRSRIMKRAVGSNSDEKISLDQTIEENLVLLIDNIMDVRDPTKIQQFVSQMHSRDTATIRQWLRDNTPGIDTRIEFDCPSCGQSINIDLPLTESFFRPTESGGPE